MTHDEYIGHDASGLAQLIRAKEVTASELLDLALERVSILNPEVNAVVRLMEEDARAAAERGTPTGVFAGVPFCRTPHFRRESSHRRYRGQARYGTCP